MDNERAHGTYNKFNCYLYISFHQKAVDIQYSMYSNKSHGYYDSGVDNLPYYSYTLDNL